MNRGIGLILSCWLILATACGDRQKGEIAEYKIKEDEQSTLFVQEMSKFNDLQKEKHSEAQNNGNTALDLKDFKRDLANKISRVYQIRRDLRKDTTQVITLQLLKQMEEDMRVELGIPDWYWENHPLRNEKLREHFGTNFKRIR